MRTSRVMVACRILALAVLTSCLASTAVAADQDSQRRERDKVVAVRKFRLKEEKAGRAKDRLRYGSSYLSDPALAEIAGGFPSLEFLTAACHGNVSDVGVAHVCKLKKLKTLYLRGNGITNAGLKRLSRIKSLEKLAITSTAIDDAGLRHLKRLRKLKSLKLSHTKVTAAGLQQLQAKLPKCKILWFPRAAAVQPAAR